MIKIYKPQARLIKKRDVGHKYILLGMERGL